MIDKKYLPSEQFVSKVLIIFVIIIFIFGSYQLVKFIKSKIKQKNSPAEVQIGSIIQKDSNNNDIPDWEEYLWGLNPKKDGKANKDYIIKKKEDLRQNGQISSIDDTNITDNEILSRQFFAAIVTLQQSGKLDDDSINSINEAIGKNINSSPLPDVYTREMLTIKNDSDINNKTYGEQVRSLISKYQDADIGKELNFIAQGISNNDPQALYAAVTVAESYQSFAENLIKIPVPQSIEKIHLDTANNYQKNAACIKDMAKLLTEPITSMNALIKYNKYHEALASDLEQLSNFLQ